MESRELVETYRGYDIYKLPNRDRESYTYRWSSVVSSAERVRGAIDEALDNPRSIAVAIGLGGLLEYPFNLKGLSSNSSKLRNPSSTRDMAYEYYLIAVF